MNQLCPVNSHNEWDPLEEVIVERLEFAMFSDWDMINLFTMPTGEWESYASVFSQTLHVLKTILVMLRYVVENRNDCTCG